MPIGWLTTHDVFCSHVPYLVPMPLLSLAPVLTLGDRFYAAVAPARFPEHRLRFRNDRWAARIGLSGLTEAEWTARLARFEDPPGLPAPLALAYHGHQFRSYNPDIGDGRGFLYGQARDEADGRLLDLGTKGSGTTPFSRGGDGRLTLKGGVREVLAAEGLEAAGVYTSKALSLVETGEELTRGDEPSPTRSSVLVRLGHSHLRFGTFQRLAYLGDADATERLLAYACEHHYPDLAALPPAEQAVAFLRAVARRSARLAASWMAAGFVHGVLNTDNLTVTGESFDYGPWRFLPTVDPGFTAAYFDHAGLYAYGRQAEAVLWALSRLGGTLTPLADEDALSEALGAYPGAYVTAIADAFLARLGLAREEDEADTALVQDLLSWMAAAGVPFEQAMFDLHGGAARTNARARSPQADAYAAAFEPVRARLDAKPLAASARLDDQYWDRAGPEGLLADEVEAIWAAIDERDDWSAFEAKVRGLRAKGAAYGLDPLSAPTGHVAGAHAVTE